MKGQFTPAEWADINRPADESSRLHMFYRHWSLKEVSFTSVHPLVAPIMHVAADIGRWVTHFRTYQRSTS
jgi:hypothetical protein